MTTDDHDRRRDPHGQDNDHGHPGGLRRVVRAIVRPHSHNATGHAEDTSKVGIRALKVSLIGLGITAVLQLVIVALSGSVALLADTIHNFADALTAVPLWFAFVIGRRPPTRRYTHGFDRADPLVGLVITVMILGVLRGAARDIYHRLMDSQGPWVCKSSQRSRTESLAGRLVIELADEGRLNAGQGRRSTVPPTRRLPAWGGLDGCEILLADRRGVDAPRGLTNRPVVVGGGSSVGSWLAWAPCSGFDRA